MLYKTFLSCNKLECLFWGCYWKNSKVKLLSNAETSE